MNNLMKILICITLLLSILSITMTLLDKMPGTEIEERSTETKFEII
mgnify:CR=1 FL=1